MSSIGLVPLLGCFLTPISIGILSEFCHFGTIKEFFQRNPKIGIKDRVKILYRLVEVLKSFLDRNKQPFKLTADHILIDKNLYPRLLHFHIREFENVVETSSDPSEYFDVPKNKGKYCEENDIYAFGNLVYMTLLNSWDKVEGKNKDLNQLDVLMKKDKKIWSWLRIILVKCWGDPKKRPKFKNIYSVFKKSKKSFLRAKLKYNVDKLMDQFDSKSRKNEDRSKSMMEAVPEILRKKKKKKDSRKQLRVSLRSASSLHPLGDETYFDDDLPVASKPKTKKTPGKNELPPAGKKIEDKIDKIDDKYESNSSEDEDLKRRSLRKEYDDEDYESDEYSSEDEDLKFEAQIIGSEVKRKTFIDEVDDDDMNEEEFRKMEEEEMAELKRVAMRIQMEKDKEEGILKEVESRRKKEEEKLKELEMKRLEEEKRLRDLEEEEREALEQMSEMNREREEKEESSESEEEEEDSFEKRRSQFLRKKKEMERKNRDIENTKHLYQTKKKEFENRKRKNSITRHKERKNMDAEEIGEIDANEIKSDDEDFEERRVEFEKRRKEVTTKKESEFDRKRREFERKRKDAENERRNAADLLIRETNKRRKQDQKSKSKEIKENSESDGKWDDFEKSKQEFLKLKNSWKEGM